MAQTRLAQIGLIDPEPQAASRAHQFGAAVTQAQLAAQRPMALRQLDKPLQF